MKSFEFIQELQEHIEFSLKILCQKSEALFVCQSKCDVKNKKSHQCDVNIMKKRN